MRFVLSAFLMCVVHIHAGGIRGLSLKQAIDMLDKDNIGIRISKYDEAMKRYDQIAVEGMSFGSLDLSLTGLRSNDAGNVFGFKLQSRGRHSAISVSVIFWEELARHLVWLVAISQHLQP